MNTDIALLSPDSGRAHERGADAVRRVFAEVEQCLSRFRSDSELARLNDSAGLPFRASPLLFQVVSLAIQAAEETTGLFDPTILAALEAAGYDRSFEFVGGVAHNRTSAPAVRSCSSDYRAIHLDPANQTIQLDIGQRLDFGGIGKGFAVDRAMSVTDDLTSRCISAGGDLAVRGSPDGDPGWTIALEDSGYVSPVAIRLTDAALATSSTTKRRWLNEDEPSHHLIDPRSHRPSTSPLRSVTVVASTCVQADVAAKTALLLGEDRLTFLTERGMHGFAVGTDGETFASAGWPTA